MDTELIWFKEGNWSHQKDATHFIFLFKIYNWGVVRVVKDYLESIEMKARYPDEFGKFKALKEKKKPSFLVSGICVDMVNKEFFLLNRTDCYSLKEGWYTAYPSQVLEFTKNNYGRLTGKRFGL